MNISKTKKNGYHHGNLRDELIRIGLEALEKEGAEALIGGSLKNSAISPF